jgi:hypothetical protein
LWGGEKSGLGFGLGRTWPIHNQTILVAKNSRDKDNRRKQLTVESSNADNFRTRTYGTTVKRHVLARWQLHGHVTMLLEVLTFPQIHSVYSSTSKNKTDNSGEDSDGSLGIGTAVLRRGGYEMGPSNSLQKHHFLVYCETPCFEPT